MSTQCGTKHTDRHHTALFKLYVDTHSYLQSLFVLIVELVFEVPEHYRCLPHCPLSQKNYFGLHSRLTGWRPSSCHTRSEKTLTDEKVLRIKDLRLLLYIQLSDLRFNAIASCDKLVTSSHSIFYTCVFVNLECNGTGAIYMQEHTKDEY